MKRAVMLLAAIWLLAVNPVFAAPEDQPNATAPAMAKPAQEPPKATQAPGTSTTIVDKLPLDIVSKGADQSGTLLSYKLKEELVSSKLFVLTPVEKKKFVLQVRTQAEFPDRPGIASQYSIVLVYQEDASTLSYYLDQMQGQVHAEGVAAEMQKILEWSYATLKRYHYLLDE